MEFEKLKKIIVDVLNVDENEITMDTTFIDDLGADSLDVFQIIMGLEEEFDIEIKPIFQKIESNQTQIRTLTQTRDTLLPKLISGEVRVKM